MADDTGNSGPSALDDLPESVLMAVLAALEDRSLVSCRGVSSRWLLLCDIMLRQHFLERWQLAGLASTIPAPALVTAKLQHFVWRHSVAYGDTLARIAIKWGTDTATLKRLNNLISDHSLNTRDTLFISVGSLEALKDKQVAFAYCPNAQRRFLVVLREGEEPPQQRLQGPSQERAVEQLTLMLQKGLRVDESTAKYYMSQAKNNLRAAIAAYEDDQRWARVMRQGRTHR